MTNSNLITANCASVQDFVVDLSDMSQEEAREHVIEIKGHLNKVRSLLLALDERRGWSALGYTSMRQFLIAEFKQSQVSLNYLYRELKAGKIESRLLPRGNIGSIPEGHLRHLGKLPAEQWSSAWNQVVATAPTKGVTTKHVSQVVQGLLDEKFAAVECAIASCPSLLDIAEPPASEDFYIGDWVESQRSGASWYKKKGEITEIGKHEIAVNLNPGGRARIVRFYPSELIKVLPFQQVQQQSFYKPGDLALLDFPKNESEYRKYNGTLALIKSVDQHSLEVYVGDEIMRVKASDLDPVDNPGASLRMVAERVTKLLQREDLDDFDKVTLKQYLRRTSFTERQVKRLDSIWKDYSTN